MIGQGAQLDLADRRTVNVFDFAADVANEMMMRRRVRIEMHDAALEHFFDHPVFFQPIQRVVNRRPRSHRELAVDGAHHFIGGRMVGRVLQAFDNRPALRRHFQTLRLHQRFHSVACQSRHCVFRLILS